MRFKDKIIFTSVICLVLALDVSMVFLVNKSSDSLYKAEYAAAEKEQAFISGNISDILDGIAKRNAYVDEQICENVVSAYKVFYENQGTELYLLKDREKSGPDRAITIMEKLDKPFDRYTLVYKKSMEELYAMRKEWVRLFAIINILLISSAVLIEWLILSRLTKPLSDVTEGIAAMKDGNYAGRINVKAKDEFGQIAEEFNAMADSVQENIEKLNSVIDERETLAENMAHELRNPLTSIRGFGEYLLKANIDEGNRVKALEYIISEAVRLQGLCSKILDLSLDKDRIACESVRADEMLDEIAKIEKFKLLEKNITLEISNSVEYICGDKLLLISMMTNLIDNAANASKSGTDVLLSLWEENERLCISVKDEGTGIPQECIGEVFKPFYRVDKSRSRENGGSGLGLALTARIVGLHSGEITIDSRQGNGTEVKVFLPQGRNSALT